jgi:hypothetical protein
VTELSHCWPLLQCSPIPAARRMLLHSGVRLHPRPPACPPASPSPLPQCALKMTDSIDRPPSTLVATASCRSRCGIVPHAVHPYECPAIQRLYVGAKTTHLTHVPVLPDTPGEGASHSASDVSFTKYIAETPLFMVVFFGAPCPPPPPPRAPAWACTVGPLQLNIHGRCLSCACSVHGGSQVF